MNRRLFLLTCFAGYAYSLERKPDMTLWSKYDTVWLKRDQNAVFHFVIDGVDKTLTFRWTLYVNDGLVTLINYEKFRFQTVLYKNYQLEGFKIDLKNRAENAFYLPFAWIVFAEIDEKKENVQFELFVKDEKRSILLERTAPKDE